MTGRQMNPDERFDDKWTPEPNTGCHLWIAGLGGGRKGAEYGWFWTGSGYIGAHVYAWTRANGSVPSGLHLDHYVCDTTLCVNPDHLRPATVRENLLRSRKAPAGINAAKTHCAQGHEFTPENTYLIRTGGRQCVECNRVRSRERQRRLRAERKAA